MKICKIQVALLSFMFFHFLIGVWTALYNMDYFENVYVTEDGMIEWYTVDALIMCAAVCGWNFFKLRKHRKPCFSGVLAFLCLLFLFGAMEEISWGQRILNIESHEFFTENNAQGETNFHNLVVGDTKVNKVIFSKLLGFFVISYILIFPALYSKLAFIRRLAAKFAVPVPRWIHVFCYLLLASAYPLLESSKKGELLEFGGCFMFLIILCFPKNAELYDPQYDPEKEGA